MQSGRFIAEWITDGGRKSSKTGCLAEDCLEWAGRIEDLQTVSPRCIHTEPKERDSPMNKSSTKAVAAGLALLALCGGCASAYDGKVAQNHPATRYVTGSMIPVSKSDATTTDPTLLVYDKDSIQRSGAADLAQFMRWGGVGRSGH
jgi:hypothetical protein